MKGWKILGMLAIVGMFAIQMMMPVKAFDHPTRHGDLVFCECKGWFDMIGPDHVSIWDNEKKEIIEADPYYNEWGNESAPWGGKLKYYYPWYRPCLKYLTYKSYTNPGTKWGRVENDTLEHDAGAYKWYKYYHVNGGSPYRAVNIFARSKIGHPFDYFSAWPNGKNSKQIDESANEYMWYRWRKYNLGKGYYCSEIVWAAWKYGWVDLDNDDSKRVTPKEIIEENNNTIISWYKTVDLP